MTIAFLPGVRKWGSVAVDVAIATDDEDAEQQLLVSVARELGRTGYQPLRRVDLRCESELVTLVGQVPSYFLKQLVQVVALSVSGVMQVKNQLRVANGTTEPSDVGGRHQY